MKTRTWVAYLACVMVGFALSGLPQPRLNGQDKPANLERPKWEYKMVDHPDVKQLNKLGEAGWELVAILPGGPGSGGQIETCYMKRRSP